MGTSSASTPTILSIASGKGGVGKSIIASNLGLLLAKHGKRVILVDLDIGGANLHVLFGIFSPTGTLTDFVNRRVKTVESIAQGIQGYPGLRLIPGTGETLATSNLPHSKKKRLIRHLRELQTDIVLVDVGAGTSFHALDFFLLADRYLAIATPEPTSVLDLYRFIKLAAIRKVLSMFLARDPVSEALLDRDFESVQEVLEAVGKTNEAGKQIAESTLKGFEPFLILNRMSGGSRVNTLHLQQMLKRYIGSSIVVLGDIPDDKMVERSVQKYLPIVDLAPNAPAALALAQIANNLVQRL